MSTHSTHRPTFQITQDFEGIIDPQYANYRVSFKLHPDDVWTIDNQAGTLDEAKARQGALETIFA